MKKTAIRSGGIAAFLAAALVALSSPLSAIFTVPALAYVLVIAVYALTAWVLWTTKALFQRRGYPGADRLLIMLIVYPGLVLVLGFAIDRAGLFEKLGVEGTAQRFELEMGAQMAVMVIWAVLGFVFGLRALKFGARVRGPWIAAGIIYVVGWTIFAIGPIWLLYEAAANLAGEETGTAYSVIAAYGFMLLGAAVLLGAWICHGIGLVLGASEKAA
jgi:hypothetical protein